MNRSRRHLLVACGLISACVMPTAVDAADFAPGVNLPLCTASAVSGPTAQSRWTAYTFAYEIIGERYEGPNSGYGCWVDNNSKDPGEGSDCSGFAGRAWFLPSFSSSNNPSLALRVWPRLTKLVTHPSSGFYVSTSANNNWTTTSQPKLMDLGAKNGHVVLIVIDHGGGMYTVLEQTNDGGGGRLYTRRLDDIAVYRWRTGWLPGSVSPPV